MWHLMVKYKLDAWQKIDHIEAAEDETPEDTEARKSYLLNEYKVVFGQGYMFKWEKGE